MSYALLAIALGTALLLAAAILLALALLINDRRRVDLLAGRLQAETELELATREALQAMRSAVRDRFSR